MKVARRWVEWQELWRAAVIAFAFCRRIQTLLQPRFVIFNTAI
jgi:hypothetical protein